MRSPFRRRTLVLLLVACPVLALFLAFGEYAPGLRSFAKAALALGCVALVLEAMSALSPRPGRREAQTSDTDPTDGQDG